MTFLRDHLWLWGQTPGSHHASGVYNLPGVNRMTSAEGCTFFGIKNCCRVAMTAGPFPPFDAESEALRHLDNVVWSIIGAGGVHRNEEHFGDLEEVIRQAKLFPNITGAVMDDFLLNEERRKNFTPEKLTVLKKHLREDAGRPLDFWTVYYDREMHIPVQDYLDVFDVITFWTWFGYNIPKLDENLEKLFAATPGKRRLAGCYMWDYGCAKPLTPELMQYQLDVYKKYMLTGMLDGVILCSNCIADIGIAEVDQTRKWIEENGSITINHRASEVCSRIL